MTLYVPCADPDPYFNDFLDGIERPRIAWLSETGGRCHDCGTPDGGLHHAGCDMEECPKCGYQAICCPCIEDDPDA